MFKKWRAKGGTNQSRITRFKNLIAHTKVEKPNLEPIYAKFQYLKNMQAQTKQKVNKKEKKNI